MCAYEDRLDDHQLSKLPRSGHLVLSSALSGYRERIPAQLEAVMHKRFILLLGMFLGAHVPTAAQTPALQIIRSQEHVAPIITMLPTVSTPLPAASFLPFPDPGKSAANFSLLFARAY
jgi:hypothetical protein